MAGLNSLPPPPKGQTGMTLDQFQHLPPPPTGQTGVTLDQIQKSKPDLLQKVGNAVNSVIPGKQIGESLVKAGTNLSNLATGGIQKFEQNLPENTVDVPKLAGDYGNAALTALSPEVGGGTAPTLAGGIARVGGNTALGAGLGATNALSQGGDVGAGAGTGAALGGALSGVGEATGALTNNLPKWLAKAALPKLDSKNLDYAIQNTKVGGIQSMAQKSNASVKNYESQIQTVLSHPDQSGQLSYTPASMLGKALQQFPNSNYTPADLIKNAQNIAPGVGKLLDKFESGTANIQEINTIRKELDSATKSVYTTLNRPPESKMLGAALSNQLRDYVQSVAPETKPIFGEYSKEIGLNKALQSAAKKGETKVSLKDMIAAGGGFASGGFHGALEAIIAERALTSPALQMAAAKGLSGASKITTPVAQTAFKGLKAPIIKNATNSQ